MYTGRAGRPRREFNGDLLERAYDLRGPTGLASIFHSSSRTVRRRALEYGITEPGLPIFVEYENEDTGEIMRFHRSEIAQPGSQDGLRNEELDTVMHRMLEIFPTFGRRMLAGQLRYLGHQIPRERIRASYERVMGAPASMISHTITRRVYRVAGPNALWHHDGQHGKQIECEILSIF